EVLGEEVGGLPNAAAGPGDKHRVAGWIGRIHHDPTNAAGVFAAILGGRPNWRPLLGRLRVRGGLRENAEARADRVGARFTQAAAGYRLWQPQFPEVERADRRAGVGDGQRPVALRTAAARPVENVAQRSLGREWPCANWSASILNRIGGRVVEDRVVEVV